MKNFIIGAFCGFFAGAYLMYTGDEARKAKSETIYEAHKK